MHRYMYHSSTENSRQTATTSTAPKPTSKWVINMSSNPLTEAQEQLLAHGLNFVISPRRPPTGDYIAAVKQTCQSLTKGEAEELKAEVKAVLKKIQPPRSNISRVEQNALKELREDNTRVVPNCRQGDMFGCNGQRAANQESTRVIESRNIQDHSCWPH